MWRRYGAIRRGGGWRGRVPGFDLIAGPDTDLPEVAEGVGIGSGRAFDPRCCEIMAQLSPGMRPLQESSSGPPEEGREHLQEQRQLAQRHRLGKAGFCQLVSIFRRRLV